MLLTVGIVLSWILSPLHALAVVMALLALDRLLLYAESRGWVNYRRVGLSRGGATYHLLELSSIFDPGFEQIIEVKHADEKAQDEAGGPRGPDE